MRKVEFVLFFHECQKFSIECTKFYKNENKRYLDQFFLHRIEKHLHTKLGEMLK